MTAARVMPSRPRPTSGGSSHRPYGTEARAIEPGPRRGVAVEAGMETEVGIETEAGTEW